MDDKGFLRILDTTVCDGRASFGGGLYVADAHLLLADSAVRDNAAGSIEAFGGGGLTQRGGGIVNENEGRMSITNSSVLDNRAGSFGGGIAKLGGPGANSVLDLHFVTITGGSGMRPGSGRASVTASGVRGP